MGENTARYPTEKYFWFLDTLNISLLFVCCADMEAMYLSAPLKCWVK